MKRVILPGKSPKNASWLYEAKKLFADFEFVQYDHWKNEKFSVTKDLEKVTKLFTKDAFVYGKSIGAYYALTSEKVSKRVLCGLPLLFARMHGFDVIKALNETKVPTLVVQRENDPSGKFESIKVNNDLVKLIKIDGDSHDYKLTEIHKIAEKQGFYD